MNAFISTGKINSSLELKKSKNGKDFVNFLFLLDSRYKDKTAGNISITAFYDMAQDVCTNYKKDDYCLIEGYIEVSKDNNGKYQTKMYLTSIKAINEREIFVKEQKTELVKEDEAKIVKEDLEDSKEEQEEFKTCDWNFENDKNPLDEDELPF